jgi:hypothetical protein
VLRTSHPTSSGVCPCSSWEWWLPSGKLSHNYGKSPFF